MGGRRCALMGGAAGRTALVTILRRISSCSLIRDARRAAVARTQSFLTTTNGILVLLGVGLIVVLIGLALLPLGALLGNSISPITMSSGILRVVGPSSALTLRFLFSQMCILGTCRLG